MGLCQCRDACWCCECVENSNLNVTVILDLNRPSTTLGPMLRQHSGNIVWALCYHRSQRWGLTLKHSHNIAWTLSQCQSPTLRVTLPQCLHDVVSTLVPYIESDLATSFTQHCLNIVSTFADIGQNCDNIVAMLVFWSKHNIGTTFTQCCLDVLTMLLGCLEVSTNECHHNVGTDVETTLPPTLWQRCHNVAALPG